MHFYILGYIALPVGNIFKGKHIQVQIKFKPQTNENKCI